MTHNAEPGRALAPVLRIMGSGQNGAEGKMVVCGPYSGIPRLHCQENFFFYFLGFLSCVCLPSLFFIFVVGNSFFEIDRDCLIRDSACRSLPTTDFQLTTSTCANG